MKFRMKEIIFLARFFEEKFLGASECVTRLLDARKLRVPLSKLRFGVHMSEMKSSEIKEFERKVLGVRVLGMGLFFLCSLSVYVQASCEQTGCESTTCESTTCATKKPAAWYALGLQAYKKSDYAQACCLWQRACAVGGNATVRERCLHSCRCAYKKLGIEEPIIPWWQSVSDTCARVPLLFLQILFLLLLYAALLFVYRGRRQRITRAFSAILFTCAVVLSGLLLLNRYVSDARVLGVVVQDQQLLYAGPGSDYPERGFLACGQTVELCSLRGEWYKVRSSAREIGWMPRAALMSVKP
jgi:hypothetical protein